MRFPFFITVFATVYFVIRVFPRADKSLDFSQSQTDMNTRPEASIKQMEVKS